MAKLRTPSYDKVGPILVRITAVMLRSAVYLLMWIIIACPLAVTSLCSDGTKLDQISDTQTLPNHTSGEFSGNTPIRGAASCAAATCHGGPLPGNASPVAPRGSEYSLWLSRDPHSRSWRTLCSNESLVILEKLRIIRSGKLADIAGFQNCLACHNTTGLGTATVMSAAANNATRENTLRPEISEGVGCEACHGPAESWYHEHFRPSFRSSAASSAITGNHTEFPGNRVDGFVDLKSILKRAQRCASCHVGDADRDMNHDLIAAGHPILNFEFASYHEALPKHWREKTDTARDRRAKLWLAGQFAMAQAELNLTLARAEQSHAASVWPELSVFQCSDCHQALTSAITKPMPNANTSLFDSTSLLGTLAKDPPRTAVQLRDSGNLNPRRWNLAGMESIFQAAPGRDAEELREQLASLENKLVTYGLRPDRTSRTTIATRTRSLAENLLNLESQFSESITHWDRARQANVASGLLRSDNLIRDWEFACRAYSAAWAVDISFSADVAHTTTANESLLILREGLIFPIGTQSSLFPRRDSRRQPLDINHWKKAAEACAEELEKLQL